jgi:MFS family permease
VLVGGAVVIGVGECLYAAAFSPLVADLAPPALRGRYMAATALSWWLGLAAAPTLGVRLMAASPALAFTAAAAVSVAAVVAVRALGPRLPADVRLTPRPAAAPRRAPA